MVLNDWSLRNSCVTYTTLFINWDWLLLQGVFSQCLTNKMNGRVNLIVALNFPVYLCVIKGAGRNGEFSQGGGGVDTQVQNDHCWHSATEKPNLSTGTSHYSKCWCLEEVWKSPISFPPGFLASLFLLCPFLSTCLMIF